MMAARKIAIRTTTTRNMIPTATPRRTPRRTSQRTAGSRLTAMKIDMMTSTRTRRIVYTANAAKATLSTPSAAAAPHLNACVKLTGSRAGLTSGSMSPAGRRRRSSSADSPVGAVTAASPRPLRRQHAELVALGIGEHQPAGRLPDVDVPGAHVDQPLDLGRRVVRREFKMQPVLSGLLLRHRHEADPGMGLVGSGDRDE